MSPPSDPNPDPRSRAAAKLQQFRSRQANGEAEEIDQFLSRNEDLREVLEDIMSETVSLPSLGGGRQKSLTKHPDWISHYRIIGTLGEGGMGIVYLAEQQEPVQREVALKVIKLGMDTEDVLARFETERQALALMNHPAIAKVYDAGVNDQGQPYFVMELVDGIPITDFCDLYNLPIKARIQVFQKLCLGVQHAHQKSVLHRDLKPANILVSLSDGQIVVKIIDFGLARATDRKAVEQSLYTQQGRIIGTPAYMSPEQAEGRAHDIDTRTDVYSLGVILYQLLTGQVPFQDLDPKRVGLLEMYRIIREEEPDRPSSRISSSSDGAVTRASKRRLSSAALRKNLQGELDWIVMRALEKDPEDRYESAMAMAVDLNHYMHGEPVIAGPGSNTYRLSRLIRKYRIHFAAGAILFAVGLASAVLVWIYAIEAYQESTRADTEFTNAAEWKNEALAQQARASRLEQMTNAAQARLQDTTQRLQGDISSKDSEVRALFARYEDVSRAFNEATMRAAFFALDARRRALRREAQTLQPARPDMAKEIGRWLTDAESLVAALPRIHLLRRALEAKDPARSGRNYRDAMRRATALQRAQDVATGAVKFAESAVMHDVAGDAARCDAEAWPLVDPQRAASAYGKEPLGLALAQRAVQVVRGPTPCNLNRTLAWALFANGRHEEAMTAGQAALAAAPFDEKVDYRSDLQALRLAIRSFDTTVAAAHAELDRLERTGVTRPKRPAMAPADADLYLTLVDAARDLTAWGSLITEMRQLLQWSRSIESLTTAHPNAHVTWEDARASIKAADGQRASKLYAKHRIDDLRPQTGLVPVGMNPKTRLWEFYDLRSAWAPDSQVLPRDIQIPQHGGGSAEVAGFPGIIFVLLPGARFTMGRTAGETLAIKGLDGVAPTEKEVQHRASWFANEKPSHDIDLDPFFLARHELTRGQYKNIATLANPPLQAGATIHLSHSRIPVHGISYLEAERLLTSCDLTLPTEAQWEYACRAGNRWHWSTGDEVSDLRGHANLFAAGPNEKYPPTSGFRVQPWTGESLTCSLTGSFRPNSFGLFDMHGNVAEWCLDEFGDYRLKTTGAAGERATPDSPSIPRRYAIRGGSFLDIPIAVRATRRGSQRAGFKSQTLGIRPARRLTQ